MRGNKRTFPKFHICFMISMNSNSFQIQNPWAKMIWLLPFKSNKGVFENNWISFGNISIHKLHAAQWFSWEKIKGLLQIIWNMSWEFQRIKFKVLLNLFSIWNRSSCIFYFLAFWSILEISRNSRTLGESWRFRYVHIWVFSNFEKRIIWFILFYLQLFFWCQNIWERE